VVITRADERPWQEKWVLILHNRDRLERIYNRQIQGAGSLDAESTANYVLIECHNLKDWLGWTKPAGITKDKVEDFFKNSTPLREAEAVSDSHKHHTRWKGRMLARIRRFESGAVGCRVEYEMHWGDPTQSYTKDALDLANECVEAWRKFLLTHNISED
jgi:hypothetical protein